MSLQWNNSIIKEITGHESKDKWFVLYPTFIQNTLLMMLSEYEIACEINDLNDKIFFEILEISHQDVSQINDWYLGASTLGSLSKKGSKTMPLRERIFEGDINSLTEWQTILSQECLSQEKTKLIFTYPKGSKYIFRVVVDEIDFDTIDCYNEIFVNIDFKYMMNCDFLVIEEKNYKKLDNPKCVTIWREYAQ